MALAPKSLWAPRIPLEGSLGTGFQGKVRDLSSCKLVPVPFQAFLSKQNPSLADAYLPPELYTLAGGIVGARNEVLAVEP